MKKITITFYSPKELWRMFWNRFFWLRRKVCAAWMDYEKKYKHLLNAIKVLRDNNPSDQNFVNDNVPELKESENDDIKLTIIQFIEYAYSYGCPDILSKDKAKTWIAWLEKQGEQSTDEMIEALRTEYEKGRADAITEMQGEQNPAWNEEDKKKLNRIYTLLADAADEHAFSTTCRLIGDKECVELQDFIKSLTTQSQWKPSEEQMQALAEALSLAKNCGEESAFDLRTLHEQLKKLKGE